jgi:SPP1 gp7 family putative phage head morphogenesis protein
MSRKQTQAFLNVLEMSGQKAEQWVRVPLGESLPLYENKHTNEYLTDLQGKSGSNVYDQMRKSDTNVKMVLRVCKYPIVACSWRITNDGDEKLDDITAVANAYFMEQMKQSWQGLLFNILTMLEFGFSVFEIVWAPWPYQGKTYLAPKLQFRQQQSIEDIDAETGLMTQNKRDGSEAKIPFSQLVFFILEQEGDDFRGNSLLRSAYRNWYYKDKFLNQWSIAIERNVGGVPVATLPEKYAAQDNPVRQGLERALKDYITHTTQWISIPEGVKIDFVEGKINDQVLTNAINNMDLGIAKSVLVQFLELGTGGNGGAYALSRNLSDIFIQGLQSVVNQIQTVFDRYVLKPFVDANFGEQDNYPRLKAANLDMARKQANFDNLLKLIGTGSIEIKRQDEQELRRALDFRPLTEEELQEEKTPRAITAGRQFGNFSNVLSHKGKQYLASKREASAFLSGVSIRARKKQIDDAADKTNDFMCGWMLEAGAKLREDIRRTLSNGNTPAQGLKDIPTPYLAKYTAALKKEIETMALAGWNDGFGKWEQHTAEQKQARAARTPLSAQLAKKKGLPSSLRAYIDNKAESVAEDQMVNLRIKAVYTAQKGVNDGLSVEQILANLTDTINDYAVSNKIVQGADLAASEAVNTGEQQFYKTQVADELHAFEFVAIIDDKTTEWCRQCNGHWYTPWGPAYNRVITPCHFGCRSMLEPVWKVAGQILRAPDNFIPSVAIAGGF